MSKNCDLCGGYDDTGWDTCSKCSKEFETAIRLEGESEEEFKARFKFERAQREYHQFMMREARR